MLTTTMKYAEKYNYLDEKFQKAFCFLRETDLLALPVGNVPIDGEEVYANVQSYTTMTPEDCPFEAHRKYFDIQYVAEGEEVFGYEPLDNLTPAMEYDEERDASCGVGLFFMGITMGFYVTRNMCCVKKISRLCRKIGRSMIK